MDYAERMASRAAAMDRIGALLSRGAGDMGDAGGLYQLALGYRGDAELMRPVVEAAVVYMRGGGDAQDWPALRDAVQAYEEADHD